MWELLVATMVMLTTTATKRATHQIFEVDSTSALLKLKKLPANS